jgi:hypothetical protein
MCSGCIGSLQRRKTDAAKKAVKSIRDSVKVVFSNSGSAAR